MLRCKLAKLYILIYNFIIVRVEMGKFQSLLHSFYLKRQLYIGLLCFLNVERLGQAETFFIIGKVHIHVLATVVYYVRISTLLTKTLMLM